MWIVLCDPSDIPALWAFRGLKARGLAPLELVSAQLLAYGSLLQHRVGADHASVDIRLPDGRMIQSETTRGVLNRLVCVPPEHLFLANQDDRDYAAQESLALFVSWLYAFPRPVINRPTPQGLCGSWRHMSEWIVLAQEAGLPVAHYSEHASVFAGWTTSNAPLATRGDLLRTVIVVGGEVTGTLVPSYIAEGCCRLAKLATTELLGVDFLQESWTFAGATPFPDLRVGGEELLNRLARTFQNNHRVDE